MRILHLGWGFTPWRMGGLIRYAEDVMALQASRGHEVHYLCSGRHYPGIGGPRLKRRRRGGVTIHEVVNAPIHVGAGSGTRRPDLDLHEPRLERVFGAVLAAVRPEVLHVQELSGFPSSVLDLAREAGVPVVMTLQDYFPLCPSVRLLDADGARCLEPGVRPACAEACRGAPAGPGPLVDRTLRYELMRARAAAPLPRRLDFSRLRPVLDPLLARAGGRPAADGAAGTFSAPVPVAAVQRRRELNVTRLDRVDRLLAQSHRVEELYRQLGVANPGLRTLHLTLAHVEQLTPRPPRPPGPLVLATVDGLSSASKGSRLILDAVELVRGRAGAGRFRLLALGYVDGEAAARAAGLEEVELRGLFDPGDLDALLDEVDVGVIASTWEEAYCFVGLEFLAKGIPLLASARGGIVDYAQEGRTAWLNRSVTAGELAERMLGLITRPEDVAAMSRRVVAARHELIKPFARHGDELEAIYREAAAVARERAISSPARLRAAS